MKEWRHPAWVRERAVRTRLERLFRGVGLSLLAAMPVALGLLVAWRQGNIGVLWTPAYVVPVVFLQVLVLGALWIRSKTGLAEVDVTERTLSVRPRGLSWGEDRSRGLLVDVGDVVSLSLQERPVGRVLVVENSASFPLCVPLGWDGQGRLTNFLEKVPDGTTGLDLVRADMESLLTSEEYRRLAGADLQVGGSAFMRLLACHELLGCWQAASDQIVDLALAAGPTKDDLERLWRVERMRLPYMQLYGFLTEAAHVVAEEVAADRLRLALALGFRREADELFADTHRAKELPESMADLPLDAWERARKSAAPFRSGLLMSFVPQGHATLDKNSVDLGGGRVLPFEFIVAVMARPGFVGSRALVLFDLWGQRHEVPSRLLDRSPDAWICALRNAAPHVMELHEQGHVSVKRSRELVARLRSNP